MPVSFLSKTYSRDGMVPPNPFYSIGSSWISDLDEVVNLPPRATYAAHVIQNDAENPIDIHLEKSDREVLVQILKAIKEPESMTKAKIDARESAAREQNMATIQQIDQRAQAAQANPIAWEDFMDWENEQGLANEVDENDMDVDYDTQVDVATAQRPTVHDNPLQPVVVNNFIDSRQFNSSVTNQQQINQQQINQLAMELNQAIINAQSIGDDPWDLSQDLGGREDMFISDESPAQIGDGLGQTIEWTAEDQLSEPLPQMQTTEPESNVHATDLAESDEEIVAPRRPVVPIVDYDSPVSSPLPVSEESLESPVTQEAPVSEGLEPVSDVRFAPSGSPVSPVTKDNTRKRTKTAGPSAPPKSKVAYSFPEKFKGDEKPKTVTGYNYITYDKNVNKIQYTADGRKVFIDRTNDETNEDYFKRAIAEALEKRKKRKRVPSAQGPLSEQPNKPNAESRKKQNVASEVSPEAARDPRDKSLEADPAGQEPRRVSERSDAALIQINREYDYSKEALEEQLSGQSAPPDLKVVEKKGNFVLQFKAGKAPKRTRTPKKNETVEDFVTRVILEFEIDNENKTQRKETKKQQLADLTAPYPSSKNKPATKKSNPDETRGEMGIPKND